MKPALRFYCDSSSVLFFFVFRQLPSEFAEWNSTKTGHMLGSECSLKMYLQNWDIPSPTNRGSQNHLFSTILQLNGNFNGLYLWIKTWHTWSGKCIEKRKSFPTLSVSWTLVHKCLKIGLEDLPTLRKFCILLHCQASKQHRAKFAKRWTV